MLLYYIWKTLSCASFFFFFLQRPSVTSDFDRFVFIWFKTMAQIKLFSIFSSPFRHFFFFKHSPLWLSFQNWLFVKLIETHEQTALAYLFTIAHTFFKRSPVWQSESLWFLETIAPPFGGLGWQCVSRICSTSFGLRTISLLFSI